MREKLLLLDALTAAVAALRVSIGKTAEAAEVRLAASDNVARLSDPVPNSVDTNKEVTETTDTVSMVKVLGMSAEEFRELRQKSGYTQAQVAAKFGIAPRTVTRWEAGRSRIDQWKAEDLRRLLTPGAAQWERDHANRGPGRGWWRGNVSSEVDKVSTKESA